MPTPTDKVYWIKNLTVLKTYTGSIDGETVELLGYYNENDGGGGVFYWDNSSTEADLFSMIVQPTGIGTGRWKRVFDNTLDVKWFGAHPTQPAAVNNISFQAALDYIKFDALNPTARKNFNIFISKGSYDISTSLSVDLADPITDNGRMMLYGAGSQESNIHFIGSSGTVLTIKSFYNYITVIKDFSIWNFYPPNTAKGLMLDSLSDIDVHNIAVWGFETNIHLSNVLVSHFKNVYVQGGKYGIKAETGSYPPFYNPNTGMWIDTNARPNVILFSNCVVRFMSKLAVELLDVCNVSFLACAIEQNGSDNTPALTDVAGIDCRFTGDNGANGLNVKDCYFEGNKGLADIRLQINTGGQDNPYYGTHTFQGNTLNRNSNLIDPNDPNSDPAYTNHNILIVGSGQDPKRLFGQSKSKLVFIGNGFFVNRPNDPQYPNNYQPSANRKAIEIEYEGYEDGLHYNWEYWEFDIVEQGNTYAGLVDAPVFTSRMTEYLINSRLTPQVSEFTRVKAFGSFIGRGIPPNYYPNDVTENAYNIEKIIRISIGMYEVTFANELDRIPVVVATCTNIEGVAYSMPLIESKSTTGFIIKAIEILTGEESNCHFDFHVF